MNEGLHYTKETRMEHIKKIQSSSNMFIIPDSVNVPVDSKLEKTKIQLVNPFIVYSPDTNNQSVSPLQCYTNTLFTLKEVTLNEFLMLNPTNQFSTDFQPKMVFKEYFPNYTLVTKKKYFCEISEYNFTQKQYIHKGKGQLSIEATKNEKEHYIVFRNHAMNILFQARIVPNITTIYHTSIQLNLILTIDKLLMKDDKNKIHPKAIKVKLVSEDDKTTFLKDFNVILKQSTQESNVNKSPTIPKMILINVMIIQKEKLQQIKLNVLKRRSF